VLELLVVLVSLAGVALSVPCGGDVEVVALVGMTLRAVSDKRLAPLAILSVGDYLEMVRVAALSNSAEVIELHLGWDGTD
jgi:hypothetical protein